MTDRAATCPACGAQFRVTAEQLIQRGGRVRCGDCRTVFDGFAALASPPVAAAASLTSPSVEAAAPGIVADRSARAPSHRLVWAVASVLAIALIAQASIAARQTVATWHPALRIALDRACLALGCTVGYRGIADSLALEDAELIELPGRPGQASLQARIRNVAREPQAFPYLELTLRDATGNRESRRVLRPADYLGPDARDHRALDGGNEALLNLRLETRGFKPTGYALTLLRP